jgi:hypothetical protein
MEHQPGRGAYQSREDNQASNVWAGKLRHAPATGSCRRIIEPAAGRYRQKIRSTATVDSHVFRVHRKCGRTRNARTLSPIYADLLAQGDWLRLAPRLALIDQRPQHRPLLVIQDNKSALLHHSSDRHSDQAITDSMTVSAAAGSVKCGCPNAFGLWCKQVVYRMKTPVGRDITPDNTVLSGAISTSAAGAMGWGPPKNAHSRRAVEGVVAGSDRPDGKWRQLFAGLAAVEIATSAPLPHHPDQGRGIVREPKYRQASSRACPFNPAGH